MKMTSRERLLAAMTGQETDYVPCSIYFNGALRIDGYDLSDPEDTVKCYLDLGVEPIVNIFLPDSEFHPEVRTRVWTDEAAGAIYPVIYKEYITPEGTLRQGMLRSPDWPFGDDIPFPGNDHCASNNYEPLIKGPEDVKAFKYLWAAPSESAIEQKKIKNKRMFDIAQKYNVTTRATVGQGLAVLMFCMGAENFVMFAMDYPDEFNELAENELKMSFDRMKIADYYNVDLFKRFGGYEQTNFFSPSIYKSVVVPRVKKEVEEAKKYNRAMYYRVVTGMKPLLDDIASIGFDCVEGFEPELSNCSNSDIKEKLSGISTVWTGVSSPACLGASDDESTRKAVRDAMETFEGESFILGVTNSIRQHFNWNNTLAMVDEWKKIIGQ